jgi:hypothetical protein
MVFVVMQPDWPKCITSSRHKGALNSLLSSLFSLLFLFLFLFPPFWSAFFVYVKLLVDFFSFSFANLVALVQRSLLFLFLFLFKLCLSRFTFALSNIWFKIFHLFLFCSLFHLSLCLYFFFVSLPLSVTLSFLHQIRKKSKTFKRRIEDPLYGSVLQ